MIRKITLTAIADTILTTFPVPFHKLQGHQIKTFTKGEKLVIRSPNQIGDYLAFECGDRGYEGKWYAPSVDVEIGSK